MGARKLSGHLLHPNDIGLPGLVVELDARAVQTQRNEKWRSGTVWMNVASATSSGCFGPNQISMDPSFPTRLTKFIRKTAFLALRMPASGFLTHKLTH